MLRVATYTRVNLSEPNPEQSLSVQEECLGRYLAEQDGWKLAAQFTDHTSARSRNGPGLVAVLSAARAGEFDILLVVNPSHLFRSVPEMLHFKKELRESNVQLRSSDGSISADGSEPPPGAFMADLLTDAYGVELTEETVPEATSSEYLSQAMAEVLDEYFRRLRRESSSHEQLERKPQGVSSSG
jgi:hypothetical protein